MGHFRNYLEPQKLAILVSHMDRVKFKHAQKGVEERQLKLKQTADQVHASVNEQRVIFKEKTHDDGLLFGSVTALMVADALNKAHGVELDRYDVKLADSIKETGEYPIRIDIHSDVKTVVTVEVLSQNEKKVAPVKKKAVKKDEEQDSQVAEVDQENGSSQDAEDAVKATASEETVADATQDDVVTASSVDETEKSEDAQTA